MTDYAISAGFFGPATGSISMAMIRRSRGALLRLVRRRKLSAVVGLILVVPSAWVEFSGGDFPWWAQGLALTGGATGVAILWTAIAGLTPDWIDEERAAEVKKSQDPG